MRWRGNRRVSFAVAIRLGLKGVDRWRAIPVLRPRRDGVPQDGLSGWLNEYPSSSASSIPAKNAWTAPAWRSCSSCRPRSLCSMFVSFETSGAVTLVRIDRPPANAINLELLDELVAALEGLAADVPAAVVIAGRDGFFSAGVDLKAAAGYAPDQQRRMVSGINRMVLATYGMSCPVIAAVTGHAIAGGLVLALCADLRIASLEGRYGLTEVKVGVPFPRAAIGIVRAELATHAARSLVLSNRLIDGREALRLGLFDEAPSPDAVLTRAVEVATEMATLPADAYATTKRELRNSTLSAIKAAVESEPLLEGWLSGNPLPR